MAGASGRDHARGGQWTGTTRPCSEVDLICPFDSDDPEFARGFEAEALWERLKSDRSAEATLHASNVEMVTRMAKTLDYDVSIEELEDDWIHVTFQ